LNLGRHQLAGRALLAALVLAASTIGPALGYEQGVRATRLVPATHPVFAQPTSASQAAGGTELVQEEAPNKRVLQLANGQLDVKIYDQAVGILSPTGWRFRNPTLGGAATDGTVAPLDEPFGLHIATSSTAAQLAALTDETGYTLALGAVRVDGQLPVQGTGVVSAATVLFGVSPAPSPAASATASPSATASATPSGTPTQTASPSPSASPSSSPTPTPTASAPPTATPSATDTASATATPSPTASTSASTTASATATVTATAALSLTTTVAPMPTVTGTTSLAATASATPSGTPSPSSTPTQTGTPSETATATATPTATASATPTATVTASPSATTMASPTASRAPTTPPTATPWAPPPATASPTPLPTATPPGLAVLSTVAGFAVQVTIQQAGWDGALTLPLAPDARTTLRRDVNGTVFVMSPYTVTADDGTASTAYAPEFQIPPPLITDAAGISAPAGASWLTLNPRAGGSTLTVGVSQQWLQDPGRVYPLTVTTRVDTSRSDVYAGYTTGSQTCGARTQPMAAQLTVGGAAGCSSTGLVYFDTSQIPRQTNIASATLRMVSAGAVAANSVLAQDAAGGAGAPAAAPNAVQALDQGTALGLTQAVPDAGGVSWDVTAQAKRWALDLGSNQGLRLTSSTGATQLASVAAAATNPGLMPLLDLIVNPTPLPLAAGATGQGVAPRVAGPRAAPMSMDNASTIYGVGGGVSADCQGSPPSHVCLMSNPWGAALPMSTVVGTQANGQTTGIGAGFIRIGGQVPCVGTAPASWWDGGFWTGTDPGKGDNQRGPADQRALLQAAYADHVIPVVDFNSPDCSSITGISGYAITPYQWQTDMVSFVDAMKGYTPANQQVYFEIGNEEDFRPQYYQGLDEYGRYFHFKDVFATAAAALYWEIGSSRGPQWSWYRILTGGTLYSGNQYCLNNSQTSSVVEPSLDVSADAIAYAEQANTYYDPGQAGVNWLVFGIAIHTYGYGSYMGQTWPNSGLQSNLCQDLDLTMGYIGSLQDELHYGYPIVITETNWQAGDWGWYTNDEGNYMVDLMSYLYDNCYFTSMGHCSPGPINPANTQLRVLWFTGIDSSAGQTSGLYDWGGAEKSYKPLPNTRSVTYCFSSMASKITTLSTGYYWLRNGTCW